MKFEPNFQPKSEAVPQDTRPTSCKYIVKFTVNGQEQEYEAETVPKVGTLVYFQHTEGSEKQSLPGKPNNITLLNIFLLKFN